jgi:hypothetical protein
VLIFAGIAFERVARRPSPADAVPAGGHAAEAAPGLLSVEPGE